MKIEDGKTASDALTGCAPIDWVKSVMSDFSYAWNQTILDTKNLVMEFYYSAVGTVETVREGFSWLWGKITNAPITQAVVGGISYGIGIVKKGWRALDKCTKAMIRTGATVAAGAAVLAGGIWAICAIAAAVGSSLIAQAAIVLTAGTVLRLLAQGVRYIYNFNWNQTDEQIEQEYKSKLTTIAGMAGDTVGTAIGGATCGWLLGTTIGRFNPILAAKIKLAMPEIYEEIEQQFSLFLQGTARIGAGIMFKNLYKNARTWIKKNAHRIPGLSDKMEKVIEAWGEPGSKSWSFASYVEEKIESIQNPITRAFVENAVESFFDSCSESVFTISAAI